VLEKIDNSAPKRLRGLIQTGREDQSKYYGRWRWEDREFLAIDWSLPAQRIERFVLACSQESYRYNGPFFELSNKEFIVRKARAHSTASSSESQQPGAFAGFIDNNPLIACGNASVLEVEQIQPVENPNGPHSLPAMSGADWANSYVFTPD